ncbi:MAG TPA: ABC transporter substrate-binding protein [bacterium]|nr:ABC transporter substrate-binding protein [bacterium]
MARMVRFGRRRLLAGAGTLAGAAALGAYDPLVRSLGITTAEAAAAGGTLTVGGLDLDDTLDPQVTNFDSVIRITLNVCEPLIWEPTPGRFVPALAESWSISPDAKVYTFKLRRGVKFHDGTPFNGDAVKFTMDRVVAPETKAGQSHDQLGPYDHTEVVDESTVRIVMKEGYAPLLTNLNGYLGIVSPTAVKKMGLADFARHPVGTGPFMFKEWVAKDHVTLVRNPDYAWPSSLFKHKGQAYLDELVFKIIPDASVRTGTLKSGETQYVNDADPLEIGALRADKRFAVIERPQPGSGWVLLLNVTGSPQIRDIAVRRAFEWGVDREGINKTVFNGLMKVAWSPLMRPTLGYDASAEKMYRYDPAQAKKVLEEAGWRAGADGIREKGGQKLSVNFLIIGRTRDKAMAEAVQASMRDVGVDVQVNALERAAFRAQVSQNKYDINFMWFSYGDPDVMRTLFHSSNVNAFNRARYQVPEVDRMLEAAAATIDRAKRIDLYRQLQQRVLRDAVCVPLVDTITYNAKRAEVGGDSIDALASYVWMYDVQVRR